MFLTSDGLIEQAIAAAVDALRKHPAIRNRLAIIFVSILTVCATVLVLRIVLVPDSPRDIQNGVLIVGGIAFIVLLPVMGAFSERPVETLSSELAPIRAERRQIEERLNDEQENDTYSSLELNLNHLSEYYAINKGQARASFRMGVSAVVLGLLAILFGVGLLYRGQDNQITVAAVSAVAGLLAQFIGGSCFYLYKKAQDQTGHFYDGLTKVQGTMLAVRLCEQIDDKDLRNQTRQSLVYRLAGGNEGK